MVDNREKTRHGCCMPTALTLAEFLALPDPPTLFSIDKLLPSGGSMLLYGDPKVGKSFAALQLSLALSKGERWLIFDTTPSRVLYVQLDTPQTLWKYRLRSLQDAHQLDGSFMLADRELWGTWPFDCFNAEHIGILSRAVREHHAEVVIIDTLKEASQSDENNNTEGQRIIAALTAATQPASLILIHHARKQGERPNDIINGARGANYLTGKMDAIVSFSRRKMYYVGRAIEGGHVDLVRTQSGLWMPRPDTTPETNTIIDLIVSQPGSIRSRARQLSESTGRTEEACRSIIRRSDMTRRPVSECLPLEPTDAPD